MRLKRLLQLGVALRQPPRLGISGPDQLLRLLGDARAARLARLHPHLVVQVLQPEPGGDQQPADLLRV
jgi:hypothetical protein